jgi:hypothetical protein
MSRMLISVHLHVLILIFGVILVPLLVGIIRKRCKPPLVSFTSEQDNKLRLDVASIVPVGVLLWNLCIYYVANVIDPVRPSEITGSIQHLTFEGAIAAAGESTVALATAIIFCRLWGSIWADISKP